MVDKSVADICGSGYPRAVSARRRVSKPRPGTGTRCRAKSNPSRADGSADQSKQIGTLPAGAGTDLTGGDPPDSAGPFTTRVAVLAQPEGDG